MIRRDAKLPDGAAAWVLISQIEHARISAQLAAHCVGFFSDPALTDVRREVLTAIARHDDGWGEWEQAPRIDAKLHRPVSFMELELSEALEIWSKSVAAAAKHGELAARMVGGHFARLLEKSEHARHHAKAAAWLADIQQRRDDALSASKAMNPSLPARDIAREALQWLWTFDEVSLWFCCTCPAAGQARPNIEQPAVVGRWTPIEMELEAAGDIARDQPSRGIASAKPWRFDYAAIDLEAAARIVPARRYENAEALFAAARPHTLRWQFIAPIDRHLA
jgi:hypothetical protein